MSIIYKAETTECMQFYWRIERNVWPDNVIGHVIDHVIGHVVGHVVGH